MAGLVRYDDLERRFGVNRRTIQRWIRTRGFPQPVELSPGSVRFRSHEVDAWERGRASKRSDARLSQGEAFQQLNELLSEITGAGDFALEMEEENEEYKDEPDAYVPGPITLADLYSAYLSYLREPETATAARNAIEVRPQLATFLQTFNPLASDTGARFSKE
jgi:prophage regulatory protein